MELNVEEEFPMLNGATYLDNAGAALPSKTQLESCAHEILGKLQLNPHTSPPISGEIDEIRNEVLRFCNASEEDHSVIFTSGATAALKMVAQYFPFGENSTFAYHKECHSSAVGMREIARDKKAHVARISRQSDIAAFCRDTGARTGANLLVLPAMSNFCGAKFDLKEIPQIRRQNWLVCLDAAAFAATNPLHLDEIRPDFCCLSFYKVFGYPTGVGALVARKTSLKLLKKNYFGGGTVELHLVDSDRSFPRTTLEHFFEDGTLPFQQILALRQGFSWLNALPGGIGGVSEHVFKLSQELHRELISLKHENGQDLCVIYASGHFSDIVTQGGIVNFNLLKPDGSHFGFNSFERIAKMEKVIVRTGCFCNIGACQLYLGYDDQIALKNFQDGHVCGDEVDVINGRPVGSIRVSFGYHSSRKDIAKVVQILQENFLNPEVESFPRSSNSSVGEIEMIQLYPIKSCAPIEVERWMATSRGLKFDRNWAIMRGETCLTQKKLRALCLLKPKMDLDLQTMTLTYPTMPPITIDIKESVEGGSSFSTCVGKVCNEEMQGHLYGQQVSEWLEEALGQTNLKLVKVIQRKSAEFQNHLTLANEAPYLVLNYASADFIRSKVDQIDTKDLLRQFRGNLVIKGPGVFSEDSWKKLKIGPTFELQQHSRCQRCSMIGIDQKDCGNVEGLIRALTYMTERKFSFGILCKVSNCQIESEIRIGDKVFIEEK